MHKPSRRRRSSCRESLCEQSILALLALVMLVTLAACTPGSRGNETGTADLTPGSTASYDADMTSELEGRPPSILFWTPEQQEWGYKNISRIRPTRTIYASDEVYPLPSEPMDLSGVSYEVDGQRYTLDDYLTQRRVAGFLVIKDGKIVQERYLLGNDEDSRWMSFSIAKSVVSMLLGVAIREGYIESVDEPITDYLPRLRDSAYDRVTIRDVLQMASGVAWNEDYADPSSDVNRVPGGTLPLFAYLRDLPNQAPPGEEFNYNTGETHLVGALLRSAIGNNLATYLTHKIWQPFGMESDADWMLEQPGGVEHGGCCIMATLRDYGRLGLFAMGGGVLLDGTRVLPENWIAESTSPSEGFDGYGYLWWLRDGGAYSGIGVFGQLIWIDPQSELVIVTHSAWPEAGGDELREHRWAMVGAVAEAVNRL